MKNLIMGASIATAILLLTTAHPLITIYTSIMICCICTSELALYWSLGMKIGIAEAFGLILVLVFAIQYVTHLAINYRFND